MSALTNYLRKLTLAAGASSLLTDLEALEADETSPDETESESAQE